MLAGILFAISLSAAGGAIGLVTSANTSVEFWIARGLFTAGALSLVGSFISWVRRYNQRPLASLGLVWIAGVLTAFGSMGCLVGGVVWVSSRENALQTLAVAPEPPKNFGQLQMPGTETLLSVKAGQARRVIEIGDSGSKFVLTGPQGVSWLHFAKNYDLLIETVEGDLEVSTQVRDQKGRLVAELVRNEWKVAPPPRTWDRNYNKTALEVRSENGDVVLQVKLLPDRVQIQGEWWMDAVHGIRLV